MVITKVCLNCVSDFLAKDSRQKFCNRSCAAIYNNKKSPKKQAKLQSIDCKRCGKAVPLKPKKTGGYYVRQYCDQCSTIAGHEARGRNVTPFGLRTKAEIFASRGNWQSARTAIRKHASEVFALFGKPKCCEICGYDKHFEICHIKAVSKFKGEATLNEINAIANLIALCPNHHWEFDNGLLEISRGLESNQLSEAYETSMVFRSTSPA